MGQLKKLLLTLTIILLSIFNLTAAEKGSVNYFKELADNNEYKALLKTVFNDEGLDEALEGYKKLTQTISTYKYQPWMQDLSLSRACMIVARYATEVKPERKDIAKAYMQAADKLLESGIAKGSPISASEILLALSNSFWYLIDGSLSKGMAFTKTVDNAYENYPEDFHVLLMAADRYLHSPGIAGGNKKKGLKLFQDAEKIMEKQKTAEWDRFTIYAGLAYGYSKNKDKAKALDYALKAQEIYKADKQVNEIIKELS